MKAGQITLAQNVAQKIAQDAGADQPAHVSIQNTSGTNAVLLGGSGIAGASTAGWSIAANGSVQIILAGGDALYALCTGAGGAVLNVLVSP